MRVGYISKTCIGHFTQSDAIYHVPLSLARHWNLVLLSGESPRPRDIANHIASELIIPVGPQWSHRAFAALRASHAEDPIDVILTGIDESSLLVGWHAQRRLGIPWIAICEDHPFQSRYDHAGLRGCLERAARTWFLRLALRFPRRLLYFIHPDVLNFLWVNPALKAPLCNSADLETIKPIREELDIKFTRTPRPTNLIGYVGLVNEPKGGPLMLDVFRLIAGSDSSTRLRLIGRVDDAFKPRLDKFLAEHHLTDRVEITGQVSSREALLMAGECTVCIHAYSPLPWLYWNQVLKILEYMALGVPVVSVDYPGTRDLIEHERSGILVPHDNPAAMADAVLRLLSNSERRVELRNGGLARALQLSWKDTEKKLYEIIEKCVSEARPKR